ARPDGGRAQYRRYTIVRVATLRAAKGGAVTYPPRPVEDGRERQPLPARGGERTARVERRSRKLRLRRGRRLRGLKARPREVPFHVGGEVLRCAEQRLALLEAVHIEQHRQDVDVGEREAVADKVTRSGHGAVEHGDLRLHLLGR